LHSNELYSKLFVYVNVKKDVHMKNIKTIIALALVGIALTACGVKGDLYPPEPDQSEVRR
jgi:hypothetical protein